MSDQPTAPQPTDPPPTEAQPPRPRRLERSSTDRLIGGVAGGVGRYFGIDPLAVRIAFVILAFAGGFGVLAYLIGLILMPSDDPVAPPARWRLARTVGAGLLAAAALGAVVPDWLWGPELPVLAAAGVVVYLLVRDIRDGGGSGAARVAARIALGVALLALAAGGFAAAAAGTAVGGGVVVAGLVIACGVALVGGAFRGGARWLILPALVLALPLGVVAAADLDVRGTWGHRTFHPTTTAELRGGYEMGAGAMRVDLRGVDFPPGRTDLPLEIGAGEVQVLVPEGLCVTTDAHAGLGVVAIGGDEQGGADVDVRELPAVAPGVPSVHIDADVGVGAIRVGDRFFPRWDRDWGGDGFASPQRALDRAACQEPA
jgi:phage shock protein PspC (stress-responsive transcriptional regulator)